MKYSLLAERYAKALFETAKEDGASDQVFEEISILQEAIMDDELQAYFNSPMTQLKDRKEIIKRLNDAAKTSETTQNFLNVLADNKRLNIFEELVKKYRTILDEANGVVRGSLTSAVDLQMEERSNIEGQISKLLNKKIVLEYEVDKSILGGIVAKVGDYTIDNSVNNQLKKIKESLIEGVQ
ncbi:MAG: F0F1 ATP synthase subunit delta [Bdellovibrionales bacterium]